MWICAYYLNTNRSQTTAAFKCLPRQRHRSARAKFLTCRYLWDKWSFLDRHFRSPDAGFCNWRQDNAFWACSTWRALLRVRHHSATTAWLKIKKKKLKWRAGGVRGEIMCNVGRRRSMSERQYVENNGGDNERESAEDLVTLWCGEAWPESWNWMCTHTNPSWP
mgnify:CR=1 FL=1